MFSARNLLRDLIDTLRNGIAPAISDPYTKSQAFMAATILEFVSRQVEDRSDMENERKAILLALFEDLRPILGTAIPDRANEEHEARLCDLIRRLYKERDRIGEAVFIAANRRIRQSLRLILDQELKVARGSD
jgi:hypothetical protein